MGSKRRIRRRACDGKKRYLYEWQAAEVAHRKQKRDYRYGWYQCSVCDFWHVGRRPKSVTQKAVSRARNRAVKEAGRAVHMNAVRVTREAVLPPSESAPAASDAGF
jgi:hypothetical protein